MRHEIKWESEMGAAVKRAREENKPVLIDSFNYTLLGVTESSLT